MLKYSHILVILYFWIQKIYSAFGRFRPHYRTDMVCWSQSAENSNLKIVWKFAHLKIGQPICRFEKYNVSVRLQTTFKNFEL